MIELVSLYLLLLVAALILYSILFDDYDGVPPGPPKLPVLGNLLSLDSNDPYKTLQTWTKKYGAIYRIYFGNQLVIVLSSIEAAKEAFLKQADVFAGRPRQFVFDQIGKGQRQGIVNIDGPVWKQQRRFALQVLKTFGVGRSLIENKIHDEIGKLFKELDFKMKENHGIIDVVLPLKFAVVNIISGILLGKRFDHGDPEFAKYQKAVDENFRLLPKVQPVNYFPILRYLAPDGLGFWKVMQNASIVDSFLRDQIHAHYEEILRDGQQKIDDFCNAYWREMERLRKIDHPDQHMFNLDQLRGVIGDLFVAGHETTVTTLSWAVLYMIHNPDVQDRCHQELRKFGRLPSYENRNSLNYIQAVLLEVQRCGNIAPIGLLHSTLENTELFKYKIPKGTTVILNLTAILRNPEYFPGPEKFNPDRFLDENGSIKANEAMIPFSIGKRACAGEILAKMELFMLFSALIFTYKITSGDANLPSLEPVFGFTLSPKPYLVKLEKRQK